MRRFLSSALVFPWIVTLALASASFAAPQIPPPRATPSAVGSGILVRVRSADGGPFSGQAIVRLYSLGYVVDITTSTRGAAEATFTNLPAGSYSVEVNAPGHKTAYAEAFYPGQTTQMYPVLVSLVPESSVTSGRSSAPGRPILAPNAAKELEKGLAALRANDLAEARKRLEAAQKLAPSFPDVNYALGLVYLRLEDWALARLPLEQVVAHYPKHEGALQALGELQCHTGDFQGAEKNLTLVLSINPLSWRAHWFLAEAHFRLQMYRQAQADAEQALKLGKADAAAAAVVLARTFAALGKRKEAISTLEDYLRDYNQQPAGDSARRLLERLESVPETPANASVVDVSPNSGDQPLSVPAVAEPVTPLSASVFPDVDERVPPVQEGVACALSTVLEGAGQRIRRFVADANRYSVTEQIDHEDLSDPSKSKSPQRQTFEYLIEVSEKNPGNLNVGEYRKGPHAGTELPNRVSAQGLPTLALIFHPYYQGDYSMTCEGLGQLAGSSAWQVHFQQRPDRPRRTRAFFVDNQTFPVAIKGRAWISPDSFHLLRIETDLLAPVSEIQLLRDHVSIDYGPVQFQQAKTSLWLPEAAETYFDIHGLRARLRVFYHGYLLFSVKDTQNIQNPR